MTTPHDDMHRTRHARGSTTRVVRRSRAGSAASTDATPKPARRLEQGAIGWILLWVLGIPIPILLIFFLLRGCT